VRFEPSFHLIGISHHTAGLAERERFAFSRVEIEALLDEQHRLGLSSLLLSTCNRCELYWTGVEDLEPWFRRLTEARGAWAPAALEKEDGLAAVRHLFTVTAGLDSQILGETEILGQVRRAYDAARAAGTTTRTMDLIFSAALSAGRRVRTETMLGRHPASVASAAVGLIAERWSGIGSRMAVVLGAGETADGVLRALCDHGASRVLLLSRRPARSRALAEAWGATGGGWEDLEARLAAADLVFVATAGARPTLLRSQLERAAAARSHRELVVMDLAVPRNVELSARDVAGIELFDLDDLQRLCCPAAGAASAALEEAKGMIEDELVRLGLNLRGRLVAPQLAELHRRGVEMAEQESAWALARLGELSEEERDVVRQMADRLVRRVLYPVSRNLREDESGAGSQELGVDSAPRK
jgi:glutamyl-tRNA reductase